MPPAFRVNASEQCIFVAMAEGVAVGGKVIAEATYENPRREPDPDPVAAPLGWVFDRGDKRWRPRKKTGRAGNAAKVTQPAPATSEESSEVPRADRDPDPGWFRDQDEPKGGKGRGGKQTIQDVAPEVRNDIAGFLGLVAAPVLGIVAQVDPYCGGVLAANLEPVVDAALPLVCRSQTITKWFSGDKSSWMEWVGLAVALRPVATAIYQHHIARSVEVVRDQFGVPAVVPRRRGESDLGDHLTPQPQAEFNYAA